MVVPVKFTLDSVGINLPSDTFAMHGAPCFRTVVKSDD